MTALAVLLLAWLVNAPSAFAVGRSCDPELSRASRTAPAKFGDSSVELWIVERCGDLLRYGVRYLPGHDAFGGVVYTVVPLDRKPLPIAHDDDKL